MVTFFSNWAQGIIIAVIVTIIIEMILPEGSSKKYIKMILGIYVLYTVINPILSRFSSGIDIELDKYFSKENSITVSALDTNLSVENLYKEQVKNEIKSYIEARGFIIKEIDLIVETEDEKKYGLVKEIKMNLAQNTNLIEPVTINIEDEEKDISITEDIIDYLHTNYGVPRNKVIINSE